MNYEKIVFRPIIWSFTVGLILYICALFVTEQLDLRSLLNHFSVSTWCLILGLSIANYLIRFVRWHNYLLLLNNKISIRSSLPCYLSGFAFTATPGKIGELARSYYLSSHGIAYKDSVAALITERLLDLGVIIVLASITFIQFSQYSSQALVLSVVIVSIAILILHIDYSSVIRACSKNKASQRIMGFANTLHGFTKTTQQLLLTRHQYAGFALGLIAWSAEGYALHLILSALGVEITIVSAIGIYATSMLIGAISLLPGGLGSTETAMFLLMSYMSIESSVSVAAIVICRATTLWFAVAIGLVTILWLERRSLTGHKCTIEPGSRE